MGSGGQRTEAAAGDINSEVEHIKDIKSHGSAYDRGLRTDP